MAEPENTGKRPEEADIELTVTEDDLTVLVGALTLLATDVAGRSELEREAIHACLSNIAAQLLPQVPEQWVGTGFPRS